MTGAINDINWWGFVFILSGVLFFLGVEIWVRLTSKRGEQLRRLVFCVLAAVVFGILIAIDFKDAMTRHSGLWGGLIASIGGIVYHFFIWRKQRNEDF